MNSTYKAQNLPKNSERAKNMKNTRNYELGKAWRNKCVFKWALNCKKLAVLRRLFGSEFQTVGAAKWNERSPADLRFTRGILSNFSEDDRRTRGGWYMCKTEDRYGGRVPCVGIVNLSAPPIRFHPSSPSLPSLIPSCVLPT